MKLYISGPMSGLPDLNRKAFKQMENDLLRLGHSPVNPHDIGADLEAEYPYEQLPEYIDYLRADCAELCKCEGVVVLEGYENSRGAIVETALAGMLEIPVYRLGSDGLQRIDLMESMIK